MKDDFVFPQDFDHGDIGPARFERCGGLTKRELFAAMIFSAVVAGKIELTMEQTVAMADDLLAELEKR